MTVKVKADPGINCQQLKQFYQSVRAVTTTKHRGTHLPFQRFLTVFFMIHSSLEVPNLQVHVPHLLALESLNIH